MLMRQPILVVYGHHRHYVYPYQWSDERDLLRGVYDIIHVDRMQVRRILSKLPFNVPFDAEVFVARDVVGLDRNLLRRPSPELADWDTELQPGDFVEVRDAGDHVVQAVQDEHVVVAEVVTPSWNHDLKELWFGDVLLKKYRTSARSQWSVLSAFEDVEWYVRISNPLDPTGVNKKRLRDTVGDLNRSLDVKDVIKFEMDQTGDGVRWKHVESRRRNPP